jgi:hypothetical protein
MAIVPDKSGTRPGRPGNVPLSDPRNRSFKERSTTDDTYRDETRITLVAGNQLVISADETRNQILFLTPDGASPVYVSQIAMTAPSGIPVYQAVGLQLRGDAATSAYYCWGVNGVILSILEG